MHAEASGIPVREDRLKTYGTKGHDIVTAHLPYVSFNNIYTLPTYHMLLYGVLKRFWVGAVKRTVVLSSAQKNLIAGRQGGLVSTNDFNSRYSNIFDNVNNWKISEWLAWADVWSLFLLTGV